MYQDGKFFTTCAERRKRVPALRNAAAVGHRHQQRRQDGHVQGRVGRARARRRRGSTSSSSWFYAKLSRVDEQPDDEYRQSFNKFLDSPHRVIIETDARLVVAFDTAKFHAFTVQAMAAGHGAD